MGTQDGERRLNNSNLETVYSKTLGTIAACNTPCTIDQASKATCTKLAVLSKPWPVINRLAPFDLDSTAVDTFLYATVCFKKGSFKPGFQNFGSRQLRGLDADCDKNSSPTYFVQPLE